jgi:Na+/H+ antiporter NhaA
MSESTVGLIVFLAIGLGSALAWHRLVTSYVRAVVGATITTVIVFQLAAYLHLGFLDPFFVIAAATSSVIAAVIALIVGLPFRARRKQRASEGSAL